MAVMIDGIFARVVVLMMMVSVIMRLVMIVIVIMIVRMVGGTGVLMIGSDRRRLASL